MLEQAFCKSLLTDTLTPTPPSMERDLPDVPALRDAVEGADEGSLKKLRDLYFDNEEDFLDHLIGIQQCGDGGADLTQGLELDHPAIV